MSKGKIVQIIGPVVDVEFAGGVLPAIYNALTVSYEMPGSGTTKLTLEVQQHLGDNWVRAVAMSTTEGLKRGYEVTLAYLFSPNAKRASPEKKKCDVNTFVPEAVMPILGPVSCMNSEFAITCS